MAAGDIVPVPGAQFEETLASASPDVLREMIKGFAQRMDAEVEQLCGAAYGEVSADRVNSRNGNAQRRLTLPAGRRSLHSVPGSGTPKGNAALEPHVLVDRVEQLVPRRLEFRPALFLEDLHHVVVADAEVLKVGEDLP